jgi:hypothetical protein
MTRSTHVFGFLALALTALTGCSTNPPAKPAAAAPDKIQGKAQVMLDETGATDTALNAGGPSVYLIVNPLNRYRLFFNKPFEVQAGQEYVAEGVYAQKAIDAIGDPDQGKNGYPLGSSCDRIVNMAWPGLAMDAAESYSSSLRVKVQRFPARPVFLVTKIEPVTGAKPKDAEAGKEAPKINVPADQQRALLVEGSTVLPAPLWEPAGATVHCKVVVDEQGKIAELATGSQLCETVPWVQLRYKPTVKSGHPVRVSTEVEVRFDQRK